MGKRKKASYRENVSQAPNSPIQLKLEPISQCTLPEPKQHKLKKAKKIKSEDCGMENEQVQHLFSEVFQLQNGIRLYEEENYNLQQTMQVQSELFIAKINEMELKKNEQALLGRKMEMQIDGMQKKTESDALKIQQQEQQIEKINTMWKKEIKCRVLNEEKVEKQLLENKELNERYEEQVKTLTEQSRRIRKLEKKKQKQAIQMELAQKEHVMQLGNQELMHQEHTKNLQAELQKLTTPNELPMHCGKRRKTKKNRLEDVS